MPRHDALSNGKRENARGHFKNALSSSRARVLEKQRDALMMALDAYETRRCRYFSAARCSRSRSASPYCSRDGRTVQHERTRPSSSGFSLFIFNRAVNKSAGSQCVCVRSSASYFSLLLACFTCVLCASPSLYCPISLIAHHSFMRANSAKDHQPRVLLRKSY